MDAGWRNLVVEADARTVGTAAGTVAFMVGLNGAAGR